MESAARYRVNSPHVVDEQFDDEVVIVNLETGRYFCLQRTAATLWTMLTAGATVHEATAVFATGHDTPADAIEGAVTTLVASLLENGLLAADPLVPAFVPPVSEAAATRAAFELLPLQTYTDMQDLLLLDPIHEVDAAGWPTAKPDAEPGR